MTCRAPILRLHRDDLIVDNFAGGGGASTGIEWALGRSPDIAVNHDPEAIAMHAANHPETEHLLGEGPGSSLDRPMDTITARDHHALVSAFMVKLYGTSTSQGLELPIPTVTAKGNHLYLVQALLQKFTGDPNACVRIDGEVFTIVDIGMRMFGPRELFRAQGFRDSYVIDPEYNGKPLTKTAQIKMCGNSVSPPNAAAIVAANLGRAA